MRALKVAGAIAGGVVGSLLVGAGAVNIAHSAWGPDDVPKTPTSPCVVLEKQGDNGQTNGTCTGKDGKPVGVAVSYSPHQIVVTLSEQPTATQGARTFTGVLDTSNGSAKIVHSSNGVQAWYAGGNIFVD